MIVERRKTPRKFPEWESICSWVCERGICSENANLCFCTSLKVLGFECLWFHQKVGLFGAPARICPAYACSVVSDVNELQCRAQGSKSGSQRALPVDPLAILCVQNQSDWQRYGCAKNEEIDGFWVKVEELLENGVRLYWRNTLSTWIQQNNANQCYHFHFSQIQGRHFLTDHFQAMLKGRDKEAGNDWIIYM